MASHLIIPESPMIQTGFPSPDVNRPESSSSRHHAPLPRFLADPSPSAILPLLEEARIERDSKGKGNDLRTRLILRHAIKWAVERWDTDLLSWLINLKDEWSAILDEEIHALEDEDGWNLLGMAIQSSCGRQEAEEGVRLIVSRWGIVFGPRGGTDRSGWTPLHLASLISTPPLISFLLNRGASPHALTSRGLTPLDLVSGMPDRADIAVFLEHSSASALVPPTMDETSLSARRQVMLSRRRLRAAEKLRRLDEEGRTWQMEQDRERWVRDLASLVEVSPELLLADSKNAKRRISHDSGLGETADWQNDMDTEQEDSEDDEEGSQGNVGLDESNDSMLVFSLQNLPMIFDILISTYRPVCSPLEERTLPANTLYLYARFAFYRCDASWLEELLDGTVERIEQGVYSNVEDLAYLAFWAYNSTVLLHLLRSDTKLAEACETEEVNFLGLLEELINAIHVFIIRVAERRIDGILDAAILDYEPLEDFNDVRFEGEWTLFKSFGAKRRQVIPKASQIFGNGGSPTLNGNGDGSSSPSLLGTFRDNVAAASTLKSLASRTSIQDLRSAHAVRSSSMDSLATVAGNSLGNGADSAMSPKQITDILSGVLLVLQLYEVNPAVTIQAFSQVFFWISCELFNRILTRKKYLCRSKAVQIRMNITVLEDWVRANGLPTRTASKYLEPTTQLLRWLQCLSQVREFDTLIGTMQNLKSINPLQMRKAVRDYRYEVNEGRMTDECAQYLSQLQKDWEKRRVQIGAEAVQASRKRLSDGSSSDSGTDHSTPIDDLFDGTTALADFVPQAPPECLGELLDSRHMLPFVLPSKVEYLVATPPSGAAFVIAHITTPAADGSRLVSAPTSRSSFSSSRPMGWSLPDQRKLKRLPRQFFRWLKDQESERRYHRDALRPRSTIGLALDPPLGPSQRLSLRPMLDTGSLPRVSEDDDKTPVVSSHSQSLSTGFPSPNLRTSESLDRLREQARRVPFETVDHPRHVRENSFELKQRNSIQSLPSRIERSPATPIKVTQSAPVISSPLAPRYEMPKWQGPGITGSTSSSTTGSESGLSPDSLRESSSGRKWWKLGRTVSSSSSVSSEGERKRREDSEDTIVRG